MVPRTYRSSVAITTHDTNPVNATGGPIQALYVGGAGNAVVRFAGDAADRTLNGLLAGTVYHFNLTHVRATLTTATGLVALS